MHARRIALSLALTLVLTIIILTPGFTALVAYAQGPDEEAAAACSASFKQKWMPKGNCATNPTTHFLGTLDNVALVFKTNATERMRILANGNVGIGTNAPSAILSIGKGNAAQPDVLGIPTGLKVGVPSGTVPLALRQNAPEEATPALAFFETSNGALGSLGANTGTFVLGSFTGKNLGLNVGGANRAVTIKPNTNVGVGTTDPYARLTVKVNDASGGTVVFSTTNVNNSNLFSVYGDGTVALGKLLNAPVTRHICLNGNVLSECGSAAEYVPTIDDGNGFPNTADLVSIAPTVKNPYGDAHGPFSVKKSAAACDPNLLGFIVKPESGADGPKLNDHYLPLAISGYFPAQVSLENGPIQRGDALTSSSKPGYAMKATEACKIIGYALEDANTERQIQVFADLGENAAGQVAALQDRVKELETQNASLEARLAALERAIQVQTEPAENQDAARVITP